MQKINRLIVFVGVFSGYLAATDIPSFMHICHKSSPDTKACIKDSVEALRPQLQNGNPEYNIPSVEPIVIDDLIKDTSGPLKLETTQVVAYGGGNYEIIDIIPDFEKYSFESDINIPTLRIEAKYRIDGKVSVVAVRGEGTFHANLTNCRSRSTLVGKQVQRDGENHLEFVENKMKVTVGGGNVLLDNLFNGDKILTKLINDVVNDNLQTFLKDLMPFIEAGLAKNFMNTANQIVGPYTCEQLFPE
ncbi:uncharacterized protein [Atheta coriaria]|uniref:uncharacterized protein n=1 Tax=Dalotia coriaria TaxID=877792 RepID=UPI0031F3CD75